MVWANVETWDDLKAITLFHVIGLGLEMVKTSSARTMPYDQEYSA